jgi:DNA topoisomerase-3
MIVCIAEKPSVAQEIAKVLGATQRKEGYMEGNGYQVTWTFGHLLMLKSPDEYNPEWKRWSLDYLPMLPKEFTTKLIDDPGIRKQFKIICNLYHGADMIINCGDAGQEGELIQRWVMEKAGVRCPVKRLWISSLTEDAIRDGFNHLQPQGKFDSLYEAGQARAIGDWLLGMNGTRLFTKKYGGYHQVLSIGRVQTPTLAMIVNRYQQIVNFKPEPYWVLTTLYKGVTFTASQGKYSDQVDGQKVLDMIVGQPFCIKDVQRKQGKEQHPQLYDLTTLQVDSNKKYGFSADETLKIIQSLYEKKLTTYPRVDTRFLSDDIYAECPRILRGLKEYADYTKTLDMKSLSKSSRVFDSSKVTDHHAIIPTGEVPSRITPREQKVYDLICRHFIAVFYPECQYATTTVDADCNSIPFKATGKEILNPGWRLLFQNQHTDDDSEEEKEPTLPQFTQGDQGEHKPQLTEKWTTAPKHFTEATLLRAMETAGKLVNDEKLREAMKENGIGRPSSRAGIIETLLKRGYVIRNGKNLIATQTGIDLINFIKTPLLVSPELTGQWEHKLRLIEYQKYQKEKFLQELEVQLRQMVAQVKADDSGIKVTSSPPSASYSSRKRASPTHRNSTRRKYGK